MKQELQELLDKMEWNLNTIKGDYDAFDIENDKEVTSSEVAIRISKDALKIAELLKIRDGSVNK